MVQRLAMQFSINTEQSTKIYHSHNWYEISYVISDGADTKKTIIIIGWKVRMSVVMTDAKKRVHKCEKKLSTVSYGILVNIRIFEK